MAITTHAKSFLSSPVTQKVVNDIYSGRVIFSTVANRSILADNYKPRAIEIYNPYKAPFIDQYRCLFVFCSKFSINYLAIPQVACTEVWGVPRICQFRPPACHFRHVSLQYVVYMANHSGSSVRDLLDQDKTQITPWEVAFVVFAVAFTLAEYTASTEHGWLSAPFSLFVHTSPCLNVSL